MDEPKPADRSAAPSDDERAITRRRLLHGGLGVAAASGAADLAAPALAAKPIGMPKAPNIIVLMTDQERHHMHWPAGWAEKNLPALHASQAQRSVLPPRLYRRLPMLALAARVMMTGRFAPVNRVTRTFLWPGLAHNDRQREYRLAA